MEQPIGSTVRPSAHHHHHHQHHPHHHHQQHHHHPPHHHTPHHHSHHPPQQHANQHQQQQQQHQPPQHHHSQQQQQQHQSGQNHPQSQQHGHHSSYQHQQEGQHAQHQQQQQQQQQQLGPPHVQHPQPPPPQAQGSDRPERSTCEASPHPPPPPSFGPRPPLSHAHLRGPLLAPAPPAPCPGVAPADSRSGSAATASASGAGPAAALGGPSLCARPPPPPPAAAPMPMPPGVFSFPPSFSPGLSQGFGTDRLRGLHPPSLHPPGLHPHSLPPPGLHPPGLPSTAQRLPPPLVPMATGFPGFPELPRLPGPLHFTGFMFSQEDLDMTLYGYARNKNNEQLPGHALSGLRIGELSYGIDRILGNGSANLHPSLKSGSTSGPIDPSTLDLPEGIELFQTAFAGAVHYGVFCRKTVITKGSVFGPFRGKQVNTSEIKTNDDNSFMWEIFQDGKLAHFIDGRGSAGNWMAYVNCARYAQEQNLLAVQTDGEIYYEACKDIPQGTELLVWYGDCYLQFMGIPVALKEMADGSQQEELESSEGYQCERCGKVFAYRYYRDKHLKYTRCVDQGDRKFPCHLCSRSFEKRDRLRIHILHVHEKHRPHKCSVCGKSFSQSSSLNKHMRVHSGERPYKCVYCSKAFTASSILRTHIRQHSGEKPFKCRHCGKAFASHAAHDSHVRRTHTKDKPCVCSVCGKTFSQAYELKFHMNMHNGDSNQPFCCDRCGQRFATASARDRHVGSCFQCAGVTGSPAFRPPGSGTGDVMAEQISRDPAMSGLGRPDINMNISSKAGAAGPDEAIDVVGLESEEVAT